MASPPRKTNPPAASSPSPRAVTGSISTAKPDPPVKGVPVDKDFTTYTLTFRTNPDHANLIFTRDLGITFYEYVHHGTKGDCEMRLVETGDTPSKN